KAEVQAFKNATNDNEDDDVITDNEMDGSLGLTAREKEQLAEELRLIKVVLAKVCSCKKLQKGKQFGAHLVAIDPKALPPDYLLHNGPAPCLGSVHEGYEASGEVAAT